jgi:SAM-dependent methyltransferase
MEEGGMDGTVVEQEDLLELLDGFLLGTDSRRWTEFYKDRTRKIPFLVDKPDENLVAYLREGKIRAPGRALELGCGNGRNARCLAKAGFMVDAIDFSEEAIRLAESLTPQGGTPQGGTPQGGTPQGGTPQGGTPQGGTPQGGTPQGGARPRFIRASIFEYGYGDSRYDFIYDCGCFHHVAPHRRTSYLALLGRLLKKGGRFGLVCFSPDGGSGLSDREVYEERSLGGGLAYDRDRIRAVFGGRFNILELRRMEEEDDYSEHFGLSFLWASLMETKAAP